MKSQDGLANLLANSQEVTETLNLLEMICNQTRLADNVSMDITIFRPTVLNIQVWKKLKVVYVHSTATRNGDLDNYQHNNNRSRNNNDNDSKINAAPWYRISRASCLRNMVSIPC